MAVIVLGRSHSNRGLYFGVLGWVRRVYLYSNDVARLLHDPNCTRHGESHMTNARAGQTLTSSTRQMEDNSLREKQIATDRRGRRMASPRSGLAAEPTGM